MSFGRVKRRRVPSATEPPGSGRAPTPRRTVPTRAAALGPADRPRARGTLDEGYGKHRPATQPSAGRVDAREQALGGESPDGGRVLVDDRDGRVQGRSHREVTEAH